MVAFDSSVSWLLIGGIDGAAAADTALGRPLEVKELGVKGDAVWEVSDNSTCRGSGDSRSTSFASSFSGSVMDVASVVDGLLCAMVEEEEETGAGLYDRKRNVPPRLISS